MATKCDTLTRLNAFTAGWRHGNDVGEASPREAEEILLRLDRHSYCSRCNDCFCHGSVDGAANDRWRYLLALSLPWRSGELA